MEANLEHYRQLLKSHDWTFEFSESRRFFQRGREQRNVIDSMQEKLDPDYAIWNQFAPSFCKRGQ